MQKTTIFRQLVVSILIPVIFVLITLGFLNYYNTNRILREGILKRNQIISNEIRNIMSMQDYTLMIIEKQLDTRVEKISGLLQSRYFSDSEKCISSDLFAIRNELGMDSLKEDIYIIETATGRIVNTTYEKDKSINVYSFGNDFKLFLEKVVREKKFVSERFSIETSTNRIKKYTYQPTIDGKYIIETGIYSSDADSTKKLISRLFQNIKNQDSSIDQVELFIGADEPFALNTGEKFTRTDMRRPALLEAFNLKKNVSFETSGGNNSQLFDFIYMARKNTLLYKNSVIMVVTDKSHDSELLRMELFKQIILYGATVLLIVVLIYFITRKIVMPVRKLLQNVVRITEGNFSERAEVEGSNEIAALSEKFNEMLTTIQNYYLVLEEKVYLRTEEILKQKDQIEYHRKRIEDSINYAKYIQNSILPPFKYIKLYIPEVFIYLKPKDIVSGDFYWIYFTDNKIFFALADCTGHGVPGAFMSMIGHTLLNEIVREKHVFDVSEILQSLNKGIIKTLNQVECQQDDGMDMTICCIDKSSKKLHIALAGQTALMVQDGKPIIISGAIYSIGGLMSNREGVEFESHSFPVIGNSYLYMFSDGFPDQTGGNEKKKYGTKQLTEILHENHRLPVLKQMDELSIELKQWMENQNQVDDILVIGMKLPC